MRTSAEERLGLTLCYETDADDGGLTDIFIDDIHPNRAGYARIARDVATVLRAALPQHFAERGD